MFSRPAEAVPDSFTRTFLGEARAKQIEDTVSRMLGVVPEDKTIGALAKTWAAQKAEEAKSGVRSADGADNLRIALGHFVAFAGPATAVEALTAELWHNWYVRCAGQVAARDGDGKSGWSVDYAGQVFVTARAFVRWLWEREVLPNLPRNLDGKQYRFGRPAKNIPTFSNAEVKLLLDGAAGQHKLHLLLMLNCGMTQKDISDLRKDQLDLRDGAIERRRSKTTRQKNTPLVRYPLWPMTLRLLKEYLSDDPVYALLTHTGRRWVRKELREDGTLKKADNVATLFQHLRRKVGMKGEGKSLKVFRKTSATRLNGERRFRDLRFLFLGHSARTVADRHYAAPDAKQLAEAVEWLGEQYGIS
jgi:integrase